MEQFNEAVNSEISTEAMSNTVPEVAASATAPAVTAKDVATTVTVIAGIALAVDLAVEGVKWVARKVGPKIKAKVNQGVQAAKEKMKKPAAENEPGNAE